MDYIKRLNSLRAQELKQLCKEEGLDSNGSKKVLIDRIVLHQKATNPVTEEAPQADTVPVATTPPRSRAKAQAAQEAGSVSGGRGRGRGRAKGSSSAGRGSDRSTPTPTSARGKRGLGFAASRGTKEAQSPSVAKRRYHCTHCNSYCEVAIAQEVYRDTCGGLCFKCRLRVMDPFHALDESRGVLYSSHVEKDCLDFSVELSDLRQWRRDGLRLEVRMLRVDHEKVCHVWPHTMTFSVNNKEAFSVLPPDEGHKRRDIPQEVSSHFTQGLNLVYVKLSDPQPQTLYFALVLTSMRQVKELSEKVERMSLPKARARVQDLFAKLQGQGGSAEEDIVCLTTNKLKLQCPITMDKVQEPVRGEKCQHLQCFSLDAYLTSNLKMSAFNNRWMCPVCSLIIRPSDLRVDGYVRSILESTSEDTEEVVILPNGQWRHCGESPKEAGAPLAQQETSTCSRQDTVDLAEALDSDDEVLSLLTQPGHQEPPQNMQPTVATVVAADSPVSKHNGKRLQPVASPARPLSGGRNKRRCLVRTSGVEANQSKAVQPFRKQGGKQKGAQSPVVQSASPKPGDAAEKFAFAVAAPTEDAFFILD